MRGQLDDAIQDGEEAVVEFGRTMLEEAQPQARVLVAAQPQSDQMHKVEHMEGHQGRLAEEEDKEDAVSEASGRSSRADQLAEADGFNKVFAGMRELATRMAEGQVLAHMLPPMKPPSFDGEDPTAYVAWRELVEHLVVDKESFSTALQILDAEYDTPVTVCRGLVRKLEGWPSVDSFSYEEVSAFATVLEGAARTMRSRGMESNLDAVTFMDKAFSKIPLPTQLKWQQYAAMRKYQYEDSELEAFARWLRQHAVNLQRCVRVPTVSCSKPAANTKVAAADSRPAGGGSARSRDDSRGNKGQERDSRSKGEAGSCLICKQKGHTAPQCKQFLQAGPDERYQMVKENRLCFCCLDKHLVRQCSRKVQCGQDGCQKLHHKMLHKPMHRKEVQNGVPKVQGGVAGAAREQMTQVAHAAFSRVRILRTVYVEVQGPKGTLTVGALLDGCSTQTVIQEQVAQKLGLSWKPIERTVHGINSTSTELAGEVAFRIKGVHESKWYNIEEASTTRKLNLPKAQVAWKKWFQQEAMFKDITIDDVNYADIKVIIGADNEQLILKIDGTGRIHPETGISVYKTLLGWTATGRLQCETSDTGHGTYLSVDHPRLAEQFRRFQDTESLGIMYNSETDGRRRNGGG